MAAPKMTPNHDQASALLGIPRNMPKLTSQQVAAALTIAIASLRHTQECIEEQKTSLESLTPITSTEALTSAALKLTARSISSTRSPMRPTATPMSPKWALQAGLTPRSTHINLTTLFKTMKLGITKHTQGTKVESPDVMMTLWTERFPRGSFYSELNELNDWGIYKDKGSPYEAEGCQSGSAPFPCGFGETEIEALEALRHALPLYMAWLTERMNETLPMIDERIKQLKQ